MGWNNLFSYELLSRSFSGSPSPSSTGCKFPIYLNVYDLTSLNGYCYWFGLGIFHSAIEAHGVEYAFGAHDYPTSGVFEVEPRHCPGFIFRKSLLLGTTDLSPVEFRQFIEHIAGSYNGDTYHLICKNCNHFCEDISVRLTGRPIPGWVNRLARIGWLCKCLLPECLQLTAAQQISELERCDESASDHGKERLESEEEQKLCHFQNGNAAQIKMQQYLREASLKCVQDPLAN